MRRSAFADVGRLGLVALAAFVVFGIVAVPAAGVQPATERPDAAEDTKFVVALAEDGDATVTLRLTFDLDREEERQALERLRENSSAIAAGFEDQLEAVALRTAEETGRAMSISEATVRVSTEGSTGVVELSATWVGLAAVEDGRLVVSEPFADGFSPPGRFEVRGPEGYELDAAAPTSETASGPAASWPAGSSLDGFQAAFVPAEAAADSTSQSLPGFGILAGLLAVTLLAGTTVLVASRRR